MKTKIQALSELKNLLILSVPLQKFLTNDNPIIETSNIILGASDWGIYANALESIVGKDSLTKVMCNTFNLDVRYHVKTKPKKYNKTDIFYISNLYSTTCGSKF